jgi:addiction module HigA family antidote
MSKKIVRKLRPIHPGETLLEDFMKPLHLSGNQLSIALRIAPQQISDIIKGKRGISPAMALRMARYFKTSAEFWMNLQSHYELETAKDEIGDAVERQIEPMMKLTALGR